MIHKPNLELIESCCLPTVRGPYPTLAGPPKISPVVPLENTLASSSVHLLCTYDIRDPGTYQVGYKVTWYKIIRFLGGKTGKQVLLSNTTEETAVVINFKTAEFHLGDTVSITERHPINKRKLATSLLQLYPVSRNYID